jgi:penicillin-binding protein 1A
MKRNQALVLLLSLHFAAISAGVMVGHVLSRDLPAVDRLDPMTLPQMTVLLDRNGTAIHSFAEQNRITVPLPMISSLYLDALLATEDPRFFDHIGIDLWGIARAVFSSIRHFEIGAAGGGSTITQQFARRYFLHPQKTFRRKLQEALIALQLEKQYSKDEILALYVNHIYFGHGQYGIEAASRYFFGVPARQLTLSQAALLAGLTQLPERLSPVRYPDRALRRRNHVLERMATEGKLDAAQLSAAINEPLGLQRGKPVREFAPHFVEEVRRELLERFGEEGLYRSGLTVQTTLDPAFQIAAERAVRAGLDDYGRRHKQLPVPQPLSADIEPSSYDDPTWGTAFREDDIVHGLVTATSPGSATVRVGEQTLELRSDQIEWTGRLDIARLLPVGTLVPLRLTKVTSWGRILDLRLGSEPSAEAALIALDPRSGEVLALVGGKDFAASEFDRAMQARRQAGSAFKPLVAAAGLERGLSPGQLLWDIPTVFVDPSQPKPYQPENYDREYHGLVTLRHTIEHSRNIPTIRLLDAIGYLPAIDLARRVGIESRLEPYPSLALGAFETTLAELASAYGSFANGGVRFERRLLRRVEDSFAGQTLFASVPTSQEAVSVEVAAGMTSILRGVVERGTARNALSLGRPLAGKTGTTDDYTDAWFIGYTPSLVTAVWIGHDQRKPLGRGESGTVAALPIFIAFLREALRNVPAESFDVPSTLRSVTLDARTGKTFSSEAGCSDGVATLLEPSAADPPACSPRDHLRATLPYPLQAFGLYRDGSLAISADQAAALVAQSEGRLRVMSSGPALQYQFGEKVGSIRLGWSGQDLAGFQRALSSWVPPSERVRGADGWEAARYLLSPPGVGQAVVLPIDPD